MSDRLEDDLMEDLMAEPEGRSHAMDEADELDADGSEFDEGEEGFDEGEEPFDEEAAEDEFEAVVADALESDDFDEFWGKIGGFLKKVGKGVGSVARVMAPIASMIPIPQAQLIGRVAGAVGKVLADEGDEFDALDELADFGEDEAEIRVAAPVIAGLAIRSGLHHHAARLHPAQRLPLVQAVTTATKQISRAHGPRAITAIPGIVHQARRIAARRSLPASALPQIVRQVTRTAVRSPQVVRRLTRTATQLRSGLGRSREGGTYRGRGAASRQAAGYRGGYTGARTGGVTRIGTMGGMRAAGTCAHCGSGRRTLRFEGPVQMTIRPL